MYLQLLFGSPLMGVILVLMNTNKMTLIQAIKFFFRRINGQKPRAAMSIIADK